MHTAHGFAEKDQEDPKGKKMKWGERFSIPEGQAVLQVEELVTTSGTFQEVKQAIEQAPHQKPVNIMPIVAALVHRPPKLSIQYPGDVRVVALVEKEVWAVKPEECPLCAAGSKRVRPKSNWIELTGKAVA